MGRHGQGSFDPITRGTRRYWRFRITIQGKVHERTGPTRRSLEAEAESLRKRARQHLVGDDEEITLAAWAVDRWLEAKAAELGPAGAKTVRNYRSVLERHQAVGVDARDAQVRGELGDGDPAPQRVRRRPAHVRLRAAPASAASPSACAIRV